MRFRSFVAIVAVICVTAILFALTGQDELAAKGDLKPQYFKIPIDSSLYKDGELIVRMKEKASFEDAEQAHAKIGARLKKDLLRGIHLVELPKGMTPFEAAARYSQNEDVLYAFPNYAGRFSQLFPNDPNFNFQYGLNNVGQTLGTPDADIDAPEAWDTTVGDPNVILAVVDSGVDYSHPELSPNMWTNTNELTVDLFAVVRNNVDNDSDGVVDDFDGTPALGGETEPRIEFDGDDDDDDGLVDDFDGKQLQLCGLLDFVTNGIDDDGDGIVDDFDGEPSPRNMIADAIGRLTDGVDNDGDGLIDDFDGAVPANPGELPLIVPNGVDDGDSDVLVDDFDGLVWRFGPNFINRVTNGENDDTDGVIDDFDGVAITAPADLLTLSFNGVDDDGDGFVDDFDDISTVAYFDRVDSSADSDSIADDFDGTAVAQDYIDLLTNGFDDDCDGEIDDFDGRTLAEGYIGPRTKNNPIDPDERMPIIEFNGIDDDLDGVIDDFDGVQMNGLDDDGDGYIDNLFGINASIDDPNDPARGDPRDDVVGHGTMVAGVLGARGNNNAGITGVNWDVQIMALRLADEFGGFFIDDELQALNFLVNVADSPVVPDDKIVAANASFGFMLPQFFEPAAIESLISRGVIYVASAGNDGIDNDGLFQTPASFDLPNIIAVAATDDDDRFASFSSFGRRTVHVGAPGVNIVSTTEGGGSSSSASGTSFSAPHVTGLVGLLYSAFPGLDPVAAWPTVRNLILAGGDLDEFLAGRIVTGRRINAAGSLNCSNRSITARITPLTSEFKGFFGWEGNDLFFFYTIIPGRNEVTAIFGEDTFGNAFFKPLQLSALSIDCGEPDDENVVVSIDGNPKTLRDNGLDYDDHPDDGVFANFWKQDGPPFDEDNVVARFPNIGTDDKKATDEFTIKVRETDHQFGLLIAEAGENRRITEGRGVILDGAASRGDFSSGGGAFFQTFTPLFYIWEQISGPTATLEDADTPFPFFTVPGYTEFDEGDPNPNIMLFRLTVTDFLDDDGTTILGSEAHDIVRITIKEASSRGGGGGSGCFIATAAYGSENAADVVVLRQFRDEYLLSTAMGSAFVKLYYKLSPPMASFISDHPILKRPMRMGLVPFVVSARIALATTPGQKVMLGVLCSLALIGASVMRSRRRLALGQNNAE